MELTQLKCPKCSAEILDAQVDLKLGIARCGKCLRVMRLGADRPATREEPLAPLHFKIDDSGDRLEIRWRWFKGTHVMMLFFCIAWDAFLFFWYSNALGGQGTWLTIVFPIAHVAVGVWLTYSTLAGFLNTTRISAGRRALTIRHGPLPWLGNRTLVADTLDQLYCVQKESRGDDSVSYSYTVQARLKDGREIDLLKGLDEAGHARFLEHRLEQHFGIADRKVAGELPR